MFVPGQIPKGREDGSGWEVGGKREEKRVFEVHFWLELEQSITQHTHSHPKLYILRFEYLIQSTGRFSHKTDTKTLRDTERHTYTSTPY